MRKLTETEQAQMLEAIRRDRVARHGQPQLSEAHVLRDTVASCALADLDATRFDLSKGTGD